MSNNPTPAELDEILEDLFSAAQLQQAAVQSNRSIPLNYADNSFKKAKAELIAYFTALVPEKKPVNRKDLFDEISVYENRGWNAHHDATLKAFKELK